MGWRDVDRPVGPPPGEYLFGSCYFPAHIVTGFTLSDLLDKPCRGHRCVSLSPPVCGFRFLSRVEFAAFPRLSLYLTFFARRFASTHVYLTSCYM